MNPEPSHRAAEPPHATLRRRCAALGLPTWRYSGDGRPVLEPFEQGIPGQWLRSPYLSRIVHAGVTTWLAQDDPDV